MANPASRRQEGYIYKSFKIFFTNFSCNVDPKEKEMTK